MKQKQQINSNYGIYSNIIFVQNIQKRADKYLAQKKREYLHAILKNVKENPDRCYSEVVQKVWFDARLTDNSKRIIFYELIENGFVTPLMKHTFPFIKSNVR